MSSAPVSLNGSSMSSATPLVSLCQQASFIKSASQVDQCPLDVGYEVAFAGRSNAGKSSAINTILGRRDFARTSKTPGRTQLINFFALTDDTRLVDLPGYGFAKVGAEAKRHWQALIGDYLGQRDNLAGLVLMMDIRHPLTDSDRQMVDWCAASGLRLLVLLTKSDKLSRGAAAATVQQVRRALAQYPAEHAVLAFSALKKSGVEDTLGLLEGWFKD